MILPPLSTVSSFLWNFKSTLRYIKYSLSADLSISDSNIKNHWVRSSSSKRKTSNKQKAQNKGRVREGIISGREMSTVCRPRAQVHPMLVGHPKGRWGIRSGPENPKEVGREGAVRESRVTSWCSGSQQGGSPVPREHHPSHVLDLV